MQSLRELQRSVMRTLLDGESAASLAAHIIVPHTIAPDAILALHANAARTHFIESVLSSYPAVLRLIGEVYFRQCARSFHARHPSRSGDLQPAGEHFAQHLEELHAAGEYRYLGDIARLEWLIQEALLAGDHGTLDLEKLGRVAPDDYGEVKFLLHPSARLFASEFPCRRIWEANVGSAEEPEMIHLDAGSDRLVLIRACGRLKFHRLSPGEMSFLGSVQAAETFADAIESGAGVDPAAALQRFVAAGVIVDFQLAISRSPANR